MTSATVSGESLRPSPARHPAQDLQLPVFHHVSKRLASQTKEELQPPQAILAWMAFSLPCPGSVRHLPTLCRSKGCDQARASARASSRSARVPPADACSLAGGQAKHLTQLLRCQLRGLPAGCAAPQRIQTNQRTVAWFADALYYLLLAFPLMPDTALLVEPVDCPSPLGF